MGFFVQKSSRTGSRKTSIIQKWLVIELCKVFNLLQIYLRYNLFIYLFSYLGFLSQRFTNHRTAEEGEGISLTPHYHFHPLDRHLDINQEITVERSPLNIAGNQTRNQEPLISERKSLTTKLCVGLKYLVTVMLKSQLPKFKLVYEIFPFLKQAVSAIHFLGMLIVIVQLDMYILSQLVFQGVQKFTFSFG